MPLHPVVRVKGLYKVYERPKKDPGLRGALRALVRPQTEMVQALKGLSFEVEAGEILGLIGPNGAGKTTTLKIVSGVLHPTQGEVDVLGFRPARREHGFLRQISFVMSGAGFLSEVAWDLSVHDGLQFIRELYGLSPSDYSGALDDLVGALQLRDLLAAPIRQLSHGQRARVDLAGALLWHPKLLLLDEPTLGLDIVSQKALRDFLRAYVRRHAASCIITSHYMRDIEELSDRVILIDRGEAVLEGPPGELVRRLSGHKHICVQLSGEADLGGLAALGRVVEASGLQATLEVPHARVKPVAQTLLERWPVSDLTITELSLEEVLQRYYSSREGP